LLTRDSKLLVCQPKAWRLERIEVGVSGGTVGRGQSAPEPSARTREELGVTATIGAEVYRTRTATKKLSDDLVLNLLWAKLKFPALIQTLSLSD